MDNPRLSLLAVAGLAIALAGCAGPDGRAVDAPEPSPVSRDVTSPEPASTATPVPPADTNWTPRPRRTPTPTAAPAVSTDVVLARFLDFNRSWTTYHAWFESDSVVTVEGETVNVRTTADVDVVGDDLAANIQISVSGRLARLEVVFKDGRGYVRRPPGPWVHDDLEQEVPLNPLGPLKKRHVAYVGQAVRSGTPVHVVRVNRWPSHDPYFKAAMRRLRIVESQTDVFVGDDGIPIAAELKLTMRVRAHGQRGDITLEAVYEFSRVGEPMTIEAPPIAR